MFSQRMHLADIVLIAIISISQRLFMLTDLKNSRERQVHLEKMGPAATRNYFVPEGCGWVTI